MRKSWPRNHHIGWRWLHLDPPNWWNLKKPCGNWNCSRCRRACPWHSFSMTHSIGCSNITVPTMVQPPQLFPARCLVPWPFPANRQKHHWKAPSHQGRCLVLPRSLWGDAEIAIIPLGLTTSPGLLTGTAMATMTSMQMQQDAATGVIMLPMWIQWWPLWVL